LPDWYLVAGCLYQTVWNVVTGRPPEAGILNYDLAYFGGGSPWVLGTEGDREVLTFIDGDLANDPDPAMSSSAGPGLPHIRQRGEMR
jgi:hypothetical protein